MTRRLFIALGYLLTLSTVPLTATETELWWGVPSWAVYSLVATACACAWVAYGMHRFWGDDEP